MYEWENAVLTQKGMSLMAKLTSGNTLSLIRAATGAGYVDPAVLKYQTGVTEVKQELTFALQSYPEEGKCAVPVRLFNTGLTSGYTARQVGIYAMDPDEGEVLFLIAQANSEDGTAVPSESEIPGYSAEWTFYLQYGQADGVIVTVDPANTVNATEVQLMIDAHNADKTPHADVLATKQALIDHVNDQTNSHNVTAAQVGLGNVDNTPDSEKMVAFASEAGTSRKVEHRMIVRFNGGRAEGTDLFTFDGSTAKSVNITPENIGALSVEYDILSAFDNGVLDDASYLNIQGAYADRNKPRLVKSGVTSGLPDDFAEGVRLVQRCGQDSWLLVLIGFMTDRSIGIWMQGHGSIDGTEIGHGYWTRIQ